METMDRKVPAGRLVEGTVAQDYQEVLRQITGGKSVPRVFLGGNFIGGGDEMVEFQRSGKLRSMAIEAGVIQTI